MDNFFPYDITKLAVGPIRVLVARRDLLVTLPQKLQDIVGQADPYTGVTNWTDMGAAINPASYSTGHTQNDLSIEQDQQPVDTDISEVARSLGFNMAQFSDAGLAIIEQSPGVQTIAAVAGTARSQKAVPFGSYSERDHYRVAFVGRQKKSAGTVTEPGGKIRGRMFAAMLFNATITGDAKTAQFAKGQLAGMDVTFSEYPDSGAVSGQDGGRWLFEDPGVI